jgi:hypothetical protein
MLSLITQTNQETNILTDTAHLPFKIFHIVYAYTPTGTCLVKRHNITRPTLLQTSNAP